MSSLSQKLCNMWVLLSIIPYSVPVTLNIVGKEKKALFFSFVSKSIKIVLLLLLLLFCYIFCCFFVVVFVYGWSHKNNRTQTQLRLMLCCGWVGGVTIKQGAGQIYGSGIFLFCANKRLTHSNQTFFVFFLEKDLHKCYFHPLP